MELEGLHYNETVWFQNDVDQLQFVYCHKLIADAISMAHHSVVNHLDNRNACQAATHWLQIGTQLIIKLWDLPVRKGSCTPPLISSTASSRPSIDLMTILLNTGKAYWSSWLLTILIPLCILTPFLGLPHSKHESTCKLKEQLFIFCLGSLQSNDMNIEFPNLK